MRKETEEVREEKALLEIPEAPEISGPELIGPPETPEMLRVKFREKIHRILGTKEEKNAAQTLYEELLDLHDATLNAVNNGDRNIQNQLKEDAEAIARDAYTKYTLTRHDIPESFKNSLLSRNGPALFRIQVFNQLCESGAFGLRREQKYTGVLNHAEFQKHLEKKLSNEEKMFFDNICSKHDGYGTFTAAKEIFAASASLTKEDASDIQERAKERHNLEEKIRGRVETYVKTLTPQIKAADKFSRALREGLDFGLKGAALIALLNGAFLPALGLYAGKGAAEALTGVDFADLIQVGIKKGFTEAGRFSKAILGKLHRKLPDSVQKKLPVEIERALLKPKSPSTATTGPLIRRFLTIPAGVRFRHFIRSFLPIGGNVLPYEKLPKVGKYLPERQKPLTDIQHEKFQEKRAKIETACQTVIQKYASAQQAEQFPEAA